MSWSFRQQIFHITFLSTSLSAVPLVRLVLQPDGHDTCVTYLGRQHSEVAFIDTTWQHCEHIEVLLSRLAVVSTHSHNFICFPASNVFDMGLPWTVIHQCQRRQAHGTHLRWEAVDRPIGDQLRECVMRMRFRHDIDWRSAGIGPRRLPGAPGFGWSSPGRG